MSEKQSRLVEHFGFVWESLPEFSSPIGFFFYSFITYMFVLFFGWLLNPTVDEIIKNDIESKKLQNKGQTMR